MIEIKGLTLVNSRITVEARYGAAALERVLSALPEDERELISLAKPEEFYPLDVYVHWLDRESELIHGGDDREIVQQVEESTRRVVRQQMGAIADTGSIAFFVERFDQIIAMYFRGMKGDVKVLAPSKVRLTYRGFERQHLRYELFLEGWWLSVLECVGKKDGKWETQISIGEGRDRAEYVLSWTD